MSKSPLNDESDLVPSTPDEEDFQLKNLEFEKALETIDKMLQ